MNSLDRREKRYLRRKTRRELKKQDFLKTIPSYDEIFTFENLWNSFWLCREEVGWKPSIQLFQHNLTTEIVKLLNDLYSEKGFCSRGFIEFDICERGKMRHIRSVDIRERVVQRCFCDYFLVPLLSHFLIYDNGASMKDKGISFTLKRLQLHLKSFYNEYNTNKGYILLYDFSDYFGSIDHDKLYELVDPLIQDERSKKLYHHLIDAFGSIGLGLGSQVSQISAVAFATPIDNALQQCSYSKSYARYMDDGYVICKTKEDAKECAKILLREAAKLNIKINPKKLKICKINQSFVFIKKRFFLNDKGDAVIRLNRNNIYKHQRRINKLIGLVNNYKITINSVELCHKSWYGQVKKYKNKKAIFNVHQKIRRIIDEYNNADNASN